MTRKQFEKASDLDTEGKKVDHILEVLGEMGKTDFIMIVSDIRDREIIVDHNLKDEIISCMSVYWLGVRSRVNEEFKNI